MKEEGIQRVTPQKLEEGNLKRKHEEEKNKFAIQYYKEKCEILQREKALIELKTAHKKIKQSMEIEFLKKKYKLELNAVEQVILREQNKNSS